MSHVKLDPYRFSQAGDDLTSISNGLESATDFLIRALQREHGAAGDDDSAKAFKEGYDKWADSVLNSATAAVNLMRMIDASIGNTASAYHTASAAGASGGAGGAIVVQAGRQMNKPTVPDMVGVGRVRGLGEFQEFLEGVLANLNVVLPDGDEGKLRRAEDAWRDYEDAVRTARTRLSSSMQYLGASDIPQEQMIRTSISRVVSLLQSTETDAGSTATVAGDQAHNVESTWQQINDFLIQMAIELAIDLGVSAVLAAFTFGIGAAAGAAKMGLTIFNWAIKIKNLIDKLHSLTVMGSMARRILTRAAMGAAENVVIGMASTLIIDSQDGELNSNYGAVFVTSFVAGGAGGAAGAAIVRAVPNGTLSSAIRIGAADGAVNGAVSGAVANMSNSALLGEKFNPLAGAFWGTISGGIGGAGGGAIDHGAGALGDVVANKQAAATAAPGGASGSSETKTPNQVNLPTKLDTDTPAPAGSNPKVDSPALVAEGAPVYLARPDALSQIDSGELSPSSVKVPVEVGVTAVNGKSGDDSTIDLTNSHGLGDTSNPVETVNTTETVNQAETVTQVDSPVVETTPVVGDKGGVDPIIPVTDLPDLPGQLDGLPVAGDDTLGEGGLGGGKRDDDLSAGDTDRDTSGESDPGADNDVAAESDIETTLDPEADANGVDPEDLATTGDASTDGEHLMVLGDPAPLQSLADRIAAGLDPISLRESGIDHGPGWRAGVDKPITPYDLGYGQPIANHGDSGPEVHLTDVDPSAAPLVTDPGALYGRDPAGNPYTKAEYDRLFKQPNDYDAYPPNDGAVRNTRVVYDNFGNYIRDWGPHLDRSGDPTGSYLGVRIDGVSSPIEHRALPVSSLQKPMSDYDLTGKLPPGWTIEVSKIAPGFGRPGGGYQVQIKNPNGVPVKVEKLGSILTGGTP